MMRVPLFGALATLLGAPYAALLGPIAAWADTGRYYAPLGEYARLSSAIMVSPQRTYMSSSAWRQAGRGRAGAASRRGATWAHAASLRRARSLSPASDVHSVWSCIVSERATSSAASASWGFHARRLMRAWLLSGRHRRMHVSRSCYSRASTATTTSMPCAPPSLPSWPCAPERACHRDGWRDVSE